MQNFTIFFSKCPVKPKFTDRKMKSFMVVRAGHSVRVNINFEVLQFVQAKKMI